MDFRGLVWKRVRKITPFGLKSGQDLENSAAHPHQEFSEVPPPPGRSARFDSSSQETDSLLKTTVRALSCNLSTLRIPWHATVIHIFPQPINFRITKGECTITSRRFSTLRLNIMVFCSEHPKRGQNLKFTLLSETTRIPALFPVW